MSAPTIAGAGARPGKTCAGTRPIQPSIRRQVAQLLAYADPRCGFEAHNEVALGRTCPHCRLDLRSYADITPEVWP